MFLVSNTFLKGVLRRRVQLGVNDVRAQMVRVHLGANDVRAKMARVHVGANVCAPQLTVHAQSSDQLEASGAKKHIF